MVMTEAPLELESLESLKAQIMSEIEAKLVQKEESLWRRGQVEIRRLQLEQQHTTSCVSKLQERHMALMADNKKIRGALLEVTSKFEVVVKEMREVLRALPQHGGGAAGAGGSVGGAAGPEVHSPSPSVASTSASEEMKDKRHSISTVGTEEPSGMWSTEKSRQCTQTPVQMWHSRGSLSGEGQGCLSELPPRLGCEEDANKTFCTPPRTSPAAGEASSSGHSAALVGAAPMPPQSWQGNGGSAVLSLVSALPSTVTPSPQQNPSLGCKRLQLAACLDQEACPATMKGTFGGGAAAPFQDDQIANGSPTSRTHIVQVELVKEPGFVTLGIEVNEEDGTSLRIEGIDDHGLVGRHNQGLASDADKILAGDRIVGTNGITHDPAAMLQECQVSQRIHLTLLRESTGGAGREAAGSSPSEIRGATLAAAKESTPTPKQLRPEARVFVPSSAHALVEVATPAMNAFPAPPGFESYSSQASAACPALPDTAVPAAAAAEPVILPTSSAVLIATAGLVDDQEEVKRTLFP